MGLSFYYSGRLKDNALIPQLTEEVQDVCTILQWQHHPIKDEELNGIVFSPPVCEPVFFCFTTSGELCSPTLLRYAIDPATIISVKTQFAGIEVHRALIRLLKHLSSVYFSSFNLSDEGGYWETMDEAVLANKFNQYNFLLQTVSQHLKDFEADGSDTPASLAERLEQFLNKRLGGDS